MQGIPWNKVKSWFQASGCFTSCRYHFHTQRTSPRLRAGLSMASVKPSDFQMAHTALDKSLNLSAPPLPHLSNVIPLVCLLLNGQKIKPDNKGKCFKKVNTGITFSQQGTASLATSIRAFLEKCDGSNPPGQDGAYAAGVGWANLGAQSGGRKTDREGRLFLGGGWGQWKTILLSSGPSRGWTP